MVTIDCEGERAQTVAQEEGLYVRRGISAYSNRSRLQSHTHAPSSREGNQDRDLAEYSERSRLEDVRTQMEAYLALFEPDREAGGYVVTFPDFGYGVTQGETGEEVVPLVVCSLVQLFYGSSFTRILRNSTREPCPRNPIWPVGRASPGCFSSTLGSRTMSRLASRIITPFSMTVMQRPLAVISSSFHSPSGLRYPVRAGIAS